MNTLQPGDTILVQNHMSKDHFDPTYTGDYRVVSLKGNQVEVQPAKGGPAEMKHIKHVKYILPTDRYINQLLDYSKFGRKTTLRLNPNHIQDLHWKLTNACHTTSIGQTIISSTTVAVTVETIHITTGSNYNRQSKTNLSTMMLPTQSKRDPTICSIIPINQS